VFGFHENQLGDVSCDFNRDVIVYDLLVSKTAFEVEGTIELLLLRTDLGVEVLD